MRNTKWGSFVGNRPEEPSTQALIVGPANSLLTPLTVMPYFRSSQSLLPLKLESLPSHLVVLRRRKSNGTISPFLPTRHRTNRVAFVGVVVPRRTTESSR